MTTLDLETLAGLALEYDIARSEKSAAEKRMTVAREVMLGMLQESRQPEADAGQFHVSMLASARESIPVDLARKLLPPALFSQLCQTKASWQIDVKRRKP